MAELTEKQFVDKIRKKIKLLAKDNVPLKLAAQTIHTDRINRIFHVGLNSSAARIGVYDTTRELWVSDDQLRRAGTHKGKFGDPTKTSYYKNYKELKKQQGFRNDRVNLRMTNNLQSEFANKNIGKNSNSIPSNAKPEKINNDKYVERIDNEKKVKGLEEKYGTIFEFTKGERSKFYRVYNAEALRILSE
jgi:hypothetical protein